MSNLLLSNPSVSRIKDETLLTFFLSWRIFKPALNPASKLVEPYDYIESIIFLIY